MLFLIAFAFSNMLLDPMALLFLAYGIVVQTALICLLVDALNYNLLIFLTIHAYPSINNLPKISGTHFLPYSSRFWILISIWFAMLLNTLGFIWIISGT